MPADPYALPVQRIDMGGYALIENAPLGQRNTLRVNARARLLAEVDAAGSAGVRVGVLALDEDAQLLPEGVATARVGSWHAPDTVARHFYDALRALDRRGLDAIYARELAEPRAGLGRALADRLRRAAARVIDV